MKDALEVKLYAAVIDLLRMAGCLMWRQNNLPGFTVLRRTGPATAVVRLHKHLAKGLADIGGVAPGGRVIQIECKRGTKKPTMEQAAWLTAVASNGGIAMVVRDITEVEALIARARLDGWHLVASPWKEKR